MDDAWWRADHGLLAVDEDQRVAWRLHGAAGGTPVVVLHGGPGSGAGPFWLRLFDPDQHRVLPFDQRGCGDSLPSAGDPTTDLTTNTTAHLVADIERLRAHLAIPRWMVVGASWGATLAQAYIQAHPEAVTAAVLFAITTTSRREVDWITEDMRRFLPAEWERFQAAAHRGPGQRLVDAYARRLADRDPRVRHDAALAWCIWEDAHVAIAARTDEPPGRRLADADPTFRHGIARLVTHFCRHHGFLPVGCPAHRRDIPRRRPGRAHPRHPRRVRASRRPGRDEPLPLAGLHRACPARPPASCTATTPSAAGRATARHAGGRRRRRRRAAARSPP